MSYLLKIELFLSYYVTDSGILWKPQTVTFADAQSFGAALAK
jgi:hypothetical protein